MTRNTVKSYHQIGFTFLNVNKNWKTLQKCYFTWIYIFVALLRNMYFPVHSPIQILSHLVKKRFTAIYSWVNDTFYGFLFKSITINVTGLYSNNRTNLSFILNLDGRFFLHSCEVMKKQAYGPKRFQFAYFFYGKNESVQSIKLRIQSSSAIKNELKCSAAQNSNIPGTLLTK